MNQRMSQYHVKKDVCEGHHGQYDYQCSCPVPPDPESVEAKANRGNRDRKAEWISRPEVDEAEREGRNKRRIRQAEADWLRSCSCFHLTCEYADNFAGYPAY